MSGHVRFCFIAFVLFAGLPTSLASSNPILALFNAAPPEAGAPASADGKCSPRPGKSTAAGQHWVYRFEGRRKCWFQVAEGIATVKKLVHHRAAKHRVPAAEANETAGRNRKALVDAHAVLPRPAPAETPQLAPPGPALKMVDAGPVLPAATGNLAPPTPVINQFTPTRSTPRQVDVEALLAAAPATGDVVVASAPSASPVAFPTDDSGDDGRGRTWLGVLLMALGLVSVLSHSLRVGRAAAPGGVIFRFAKVSYGSKRDSRRRQLR
jgi:hypothetical protein